MHPAPASITKIPKPPVWDSLKTHTKGAPVVAQRKWIRLGTVRLQVPSLASLRGLRIRCCWELWCRSQTGLGSRFALSMVTAGSGIPHWPPPLGTSISRKCTPEKKKKKKTTHTHTHTHTKGTQSVPARPGLCVPAGPPAPRAPRRKAYPAPEPAELNTPALRAPQSSPTETCSRQSWGSDPGEAAQRLKHWNKPRAKQT